MKNREDSLALVPYSKTESAKANKQNQGGGSQNALVLATSPPAASSNSVASPTSIQTTGSDYSASLVAQERQTCPYCERPFLFTREELLMMLGESLNSDDETNKSKATGGVSAPSPHHHESHTGKATARDRNQNLPAILPPGVIDEDQQRQRYNNSLRSAVLAAMTPHDLFDASYRSLVPMTDRRRLEMSPSPQLSGASSPSHTLSPSLTARKNPENNTAKGSIPALLPPPQLSSRRDNDTDSEKEEAAAAVSTPRQDSLTFATTNQDDGMNSSPLGGSECNIHHEEVEHHHHENIIPSSPQVPPPPAPSFYKMFFQEISLIGRGAFGAVSLCRHVIDGETLGLYAVKRVPIGDSDRNFLRQSLAEVRVLQNLRRHPNCIQYFYSWVEMAQLCDFGPPTRCLFILQEFASLGTMDNFMLKGFENYLPDDAVWCFFLQALDGLAHLHSQGILHRDIKMENFLLSKENNYASNLQRRKHYHQQQQKKQKKMKKFKKAHEVDDDVAELLPEDDDNDKDDEFQQEQNGVRNDLPPIAMWPRLMLADFGIAAIDRQKKKFSATSRSSPSAAAKKGALIKFDKERAKAMKRRMKEEEMWKKREESGAAKEENDEDESSAGIPENLPASARQGGTGTEEFMAPELFLTISDSDDSEKEEEEEEKEREHHHERTSPKEHNNSNHNDSFCCDNSSTSNNSAKHHHQRYRFAHTVQSDLYSMGVCLHYMAFEGTLPIGGKKCRISACRTKRPAEMIQLIEVLLHPNPAYRPESCDVILSDPFCIRLKQRLGMLFSSVPSSTSSPKTPTPAAGVGGVSSTKGSTRNNVDQEEEEETDYHNLTAAHTAVIDELSGTFAGSPSQLRDYYQQQRRTFQEEGDEDESKKKPLSNSTVPTLRRSGSVFDVKKIVDDDESEKEKEKSSHVVHVEKKKVIEPVVDNTKQVDSSSGSLLLRLSVGVNVLLAGVLAAGLLFGKKK